MNREFKNWLDSTSTGQIEYFEYWNDEDIEKEKKWNISTGDFSLMEEYLSKSGLVDDIHACNKLLKKKGIHLRGKGIDLAAGNLWAIPYILKLGAIDQVFCLEYSKHRLLKLGPTLLDHYKIPPEKTILVYGSFYDLHVGDHSIDFLFLSQAFHHADDPDRLLDEMKRILKPDGAVIIIGEHKTHYFIPICKHIGKIFIQYLIPKRIQKKIFGREIRARSLIPVSEDLIPTDPVLGDHYYSHRKYCYLFRSHGFAPIRVQAKNPLYVSYILTHERGVN